MIPGINILSQALSVIGRQGFYYYKYDSRSKNSAGLLVPTYSSPVLLSGSVQPVPRKLYEKLGLDLQRNYTTFFIEKEILDIRRDVSGDKIVYNNLTFQCESITDWHPVDGWVRVLAIEAANENE